MKTNDLNVVTKKLSRQVEAYNAVGRDPVMEIPLIFAANPEHFFNIKAFNDAGIDVLGFARQADQKFLENIGGILSQKVKTALDNSTALPDQDVVDAVVSSYDFTGARATSEERMSTNNRIIVAEIRKELRRIIKVGIFAQLDASGNKTNNPNDVTFNAERVQTGPEAKGEKKTPPNSVPFENFNEVVIAAFNSVPAELEDGNGNVANIDFSVEPTFGDNDKPTNLTGIVELARMEGLRIIENNKIKNSAVGVAVKIG